LRPNAGSLIRVLARWACPAPFSIPFDPGWISLRVVGPPFVTVCRREVYAFLALRFFKLGFPATLVACVASPCSCASCSLPDFAGLFGFRPCDGFSYVASWFTTGRFSPLHTFQVEDLLFVVCVLGALLSLPDAAKSRILLRHALTRSYHLYAPRVLPTPTPSPW